MENLGIVERLSNRTRKAAASGCRDGYSFNDEIQHVGAFRIQGNRPSHENDQSSSSSLEDEESTLGGGQETLTQQVVVPQAELVDEEAFQRAVHEEARRLNWEENQQQPPAAVQNRIVPVDFELGDGTGREKENNTDHLPRDFLESCWSLSHRHGKKTAAMVLFILLVALFFIAFSVLSRNSDDHEGGKVAIISDGETPNGTETMPRRTELPTTTMPPENITSTDREPDTCRAELATYTNCLNDLSSADRIFCKECVPDLLGDSPDHYTPCFVLTRDYCASIDDCNCQDCGDLFRIYTNCVLGGSCVGDCSDAETESPTVDDGSNSSSSSPPPVETPSPPASPPTPPPGSPPDPPYPPN